MNKKDILVGLLFLASATLLIVVLFGKAPIIGFIVTVNVIVAFLFVLARMKRVNDKQKN